VGVGLGLGQGVKLRWSRGAMEMGLDLAQFLEDRREKLLGCG
jgi:hypothetical protein